jgi:hypothetical protein
MILAKIAVYTVYFDTNKTTDCPINNVVKYLLISYDKLIALTCLH